MKPLSVRLRHYRYQGALGDLNAMERKVAKAKPRAIALAALYICESILLELESEEILTTKDVRGLLRDAAKTLRQVGNMKKNNN